MIFPVLDARVTIAGATIIVTEAAYPYEPAPEVGADHWLFGVDDDSLVPFGGGATLTAQGASHIFASNYVTVSIYAEALLSNIADQATQTICRVFKYQPVADKNVLLLGNISAVSNGYGVWLTPGGSIQTILRGNTPALADHGLPAGVVAGDWLFIGYSERIVEGVTQFNTFIGSALSYSGAV
uniref:hypothetical protein n=1 Tax=uncultured Zhongshania sp. TaxID=1642288 RepID=UPI0030D98BFC